MNTELLQKSKEIKTARLTLKSMRDEDQADVIAILTDKEVTKTYMVPDFQDYSKAVAVFRKLQEYSQADCSEHFAYGVYLDGKLIGFLNDCGFDKSETEIGYAYHPNYWGRGYASEAFSAVIAELFRMGCEKVVAGYFEENGASRRVMEKSGLVPTDKSESIEYRGKTHVCKYCELTRLAFEIKNRSAREYVTLNDGRKIYCESWFNKHFSETLVYVHGGPGNGCWDFRYAADKISNYCNVLIFDQYGVLRSDALENAEQFSSEILIDDIEELRVHFGLGKIHLCGHSYGAQLVLRYALKYPDNIKKLVYLCPSFDLCQSMKNVYQYCLNHTDDEKLAEKLKHTMSCGDLFDYLNGIAEIPEELWSSAYKIEEPSELVGNVNSVDGDCYELRIKGVTQQGRIFAEPIIRKNLCERLESVKSPALLITGQCDSVWTDSQDEIFMSLSQNKKYEIPNAGHMPYCDGNADLTAKIIGEYITGTNV